MIGSIIFLKLSFFIIGLKASCPILKLKDTPFDLIQQWNVYLELYQFKSINMHVQSPFLVINKPFNRVRVFNMNISNVCTQGVLGHINNHRSTRDLYYNNVILKDFDKKSRKLKVIYI